MKQQHYIQTPVYRSHKLSKNLNKNIFYKMDCYQPSGSFKIRGMEHLCRHHIQQGCRNFVASSGGNAGYSLAYVGQQLGVEVHVVVPSTTPQTMIDKITNLGAQVEVQGSVWDEAHHYALQLAEEKQAVYVSPFDDPLLWKGHATLMEECAQQMEQPDALVVSVGGGGLLCGVFEGLKRNGWNSTTVIPAETVGAASFEASFSAGELVEIEAIRSIATSLGAKKVTQKALDLAADFKVQPFTMSDSEAVQSVLSFLDEYNVLVEPACGASLAAPLLHPEILENFDSVLVIVCGGVNTNVEKYLEFVK